MELEKFLSSLEEGDKGNYSAILIDQAVEGMSGRFYKQPKLTIVNTEDLA